MGTVEICPISGPSYLAGHGLFEISSHVIFLPLQGTTEVGDPQ